MRNRIHLVLMAMVIAIGQSVLAQNVAINNTGNSPDASALLDISSTTKGILIPRMAPWERANIVNPAQGLLVFDTGSRTFWFFDSVWKEMTVGSGLPQGPATGDLSGNYPSPNVVKLQNLDVAFGVPFDKQVLKWDALANNWKGRNDSLFLPYNSTFANNGGAVFGITTNSTTSGSSALYGKRGAVGSGIVPSNTMGVWGDNSNGLGVVGTSNTGIGTYGFSFQQHGVYGYSTADLYAGVYGGNAANAGIGVMGETGSSGYGLYGKSTGTNGTACLLANTLVDNTAPALFVLHNGKGSNLWLSNTTAATSMSMKIDNNGTGQSLQINSLNTASGASALYLNVAGGGHGLYSYMNNTTTTGDAVNAYTAGLGRGIFASSQKGISGEFKIDNVNNANIALKSTTLGKGIVGAFYKDNTTGSISDLHDPAVLIDNNSKGNALKIMSLHAPSVNSGIDVQYDGQAFGINVNSTRGGIHAISTGADSPGIVAENYTGGHAIKSFNNSSANAAIYASNSHMFAEAIEATTTGSQATTIKSTANSAGSAIYGHNNGESGAGVEGYTSAYVGYAVRGSTSNTSWGIPGQFISNCPDALTNTLWMIDDSKGQTVRIQVNNAQNDKEALYITTEGPGKLASFNSPGGEKFAVANNGNTLVGGTLTVKGNKGIVRSSTGTQMRTEIVSSPIVASAGLAVGGSVSVTVNFATAFSAAPAVTVANITSGFTGACDALSVAIKDVTTTSCTLRVFNSYMANSGAFSGTWKLIAIGAE